MKRDLYRLVDENVFGWASRELLKEEITADMIVSTAKELFAPSSPVLSTSISTASTATAEGGGDDTDDFENRPTLERSRLWMFDQSIGLGHNPDRMK